MSENPEVPVISGSGTLSDHGRDDSTWIVTDPDADRYHTFTLLSWWKQDVVRRSTVLVVGAGALGNEVLKNLALMGMGRLLIVDFDTIEKHNLSRSVLFRESAAGQFKAEIAAKAVRDLNPDVDVRWLNCNVNHDIGLGVYRRVDAVIGCLDNREARLSINVNCGHLGKPWVDGAIEGLLGVARIFWPGRGACYECTLTPEDYRIMEKRRSCQLLAHENLIEGRVPTTPTIASIIGAIQTQEALKIIHDMEVEPGVGLVFNGLTNDVFSMEYPVREECQSHWPYGEIYEMDDLTSRATTLKQLHVRAEELMGEPARLRIPSMVEYTYCSLCKVQTEILRPRHQLTVGSAKCPQCGSEMKMNMIDYVRGDEPFASLTLEQAGLSPLAVIPARSKSNRYIFLELSGDSDYFFESVMNSE